MVLGIKPRLTICKASAFPTVLSLWPWFVILLKIVTKKRNLESDYYMCLLTLFHKMFISYNFVMGLLLLPVSCLLINSLCIGV